VPAPGAPLFQAASANLNPWTQAKVNSKNPERGPLLIVSGEKDNTVPWKIANASYKKQKRNERYGDRRHRLELRQALRLAPRSDAADGACPLFGGDGRAAKIPMRKPCGYDF
jgi:hypothetical protein